MDSPTRAADAQILVEHSEEEVVVYKPKGPRAQGQKAQTNKTASSTGPKAKGGSKGKDKKSPAKDETEVLLSAQASTNGAAKSLGKKRQSGPATPVIDPDAFGRDLIEKSQIKPQTPVRKPRSRHSAKANPHKPHADTQSCKSTKDERHPEDTPTTTQAKHLNEQRRSTARENDGKQASQSQRSLEAGRLSPVPTPVAISPLLLNADAPIFQPLPEVAANAAAPKSTNDNEKTSDYLRPPQKQLPIGSGRPSPKSNASPNDPTRHSMSHTLSRPGFSSSSLVDDATVTPISQHQYSAQCSPFGLSRQSSRTSSGFDGYASTTFAPTWPDPWSSAQKPDGSTASLAGLPSPLYNRSAYHSPAVNGSAVSYGAQRMIRGISSSSSTSSSKHVAHVQQDESFRRQGASPPANEAQAPASAPGEVDYVLKRGTTREQTRGKGKLWVG